MRIIIIYSKLIHLSFIISIDCLGRKSERHKQFSLALPHLELSRPRLKQHIWCLIKMCPRQVSSVCSPAKWDSTACSAGKNVTCVVCSRCSTIVSSVYSFPLTKAGGLFSWELRLTSWRPSRPVRCCLFVCLLCFALLSYVAHPFEKTMKATAIATEKYIFPKQIQIQCRGFIGTLSKIRQGPRG